MNSASWTPLACGLLLAIAGCADPAQSLVAPPSAAFVAPAAAADEATGALEGIVTDAEIRPIPNVHIVMLDFGEATRTDESGRYVFSGLDPAEVKVATQKFGFQSQVRVATIEAGKIARLDLVLVPIRAVVPYHVTSIASTYYFCSHAIEPLGLSNSCGQGYAGTVVDAGSVVGQTTMDVTLSAQNSTEIQTLLFETVWTPTNPLATHLLVNYETYGVYGPAFSSQEPAYYFNSSHGPSPLYAVADNAKIRDVTLAKPASAHCKYDGPCRVGGMIYGGWNEEDDVPVGVSFFFDQTLDHFFTEFFGEPAPDDFRAVPP